MERYGVADSWTMIIRIDLGISILMPAGFGKNGEVLVVDVNQWLVSLDFNNWRIKVLEVDAPSSSVKWLSLYDFYAELSPDSFVEISFLCDSVTGHQWAVGSASVMANSSSDHQQSNDIDPEKAMKIEPSDSVREA
ncbi:hypothetical protein ACH5RR_028484 [Cinchona calisaya]|uniref:F-box associated domain-containing protein n=1 Tax=Cinchona calisaya TaxID=153742 RepID=A0ABD2YNZ1_9GENT